MTANINSVPRELTVETFSFFDLREVGKFALVCKEWKNSVDDPYLWGVNNGPNAKAKLIRTIQAAQKILKRLTKEREELLNPSLIRAINEYRRLPHSLATWETDSVGFFMVISAIVTGVWLSFLSPDLSEDTDLKIAAIASVPAFATCKLAKMGYTDIYKQVKPRMILKVEVLNVKIKKWKGIVEALCHPDRAKRIDQA